MALRSIAAVLLFLAGCEGLRVQRRIEQSCRPDAQWGQYIDGKDGAKGKDAYGAAYHAMPSAGVEEMYKTLATNTAGDQTGEPDLVLFTKIAKLVGMQVKPSPHAVGSHVRSCQPTDFSKRSAMMAGITVCGKDYKFTHTSNDQLLPIVFETYNSKIKAARSSKEMIHSIAYLLQNIAYMHPLEDHNGRSRMLLLQYEIRRLNLGCGTFMFNNNKDVYFESQGTYAMKIQEGMRMYEEAQKTESNPWEEKANRDAHLNAFPVETSILKCWNTYCSEKGQKTRTGVRKPARCAGTSPALKDSTVESEIAAETTEVNILETAAADIL